MKSFLLAGGLSLALLGAALPLACGSTSSLNPPSSDAGPQVVEAGPTEDAATFDAASSDPTQLADNLSTATSLTLVGSKLFWVENAGGVRPSVTNAIRSVGTAGGTPTSVVTPTNGNVAGALASDGTSLYYALEFPSASDASSLDTSQIMKSGLDGSSPSIVVATGVPDGYVNALFVVNGTLYIQAGTSLASAPASGTHGQATEIHAPGTVTDLYWADTTGLYYGVVGGGPLSLAPTGFDFYASPLDGVSPNLLVDLSNDGGTFLFGGVAVARGNVYIAEALAPVGTILAAPASTSEDAGAALPLATLQEWAPSSIAADANGMYVTQNDSNNDSAPLGIYSVDFTTGAATQLHVSPFGAYDIVLGTTSLYWLEDSDTPTQTLHGMAR